MMQREVSLPFRMKSPTIGSDQAHGPSSGTPRDSESLYQQDEPPLEEEKGPSKNELKKQANKARAKEAKAQKAKEPKPEKLPAGKDVEKRVESSTDAIDPDAMFKQGFLADVYKLQAHRPVITRFPPEPNGYLHIGHSKAIAINFGFAKYHGGHCYLRYDDTNPEAEEEQYFTAIREIVEWLGFKPKAITYSSDHFQRLYDLAEKMIVSGHGYVCHCPDLEVKEQRGGENHEERYTCVHRDRPADESLVEFRKMRDGKYKPKEAFLRMKQDLENGNPQMWDLTAYRVLDSSHHRTGAEWKIYPTYDFTHCLCDSFEEISHSLCTTEFINSRESYEWLCHALDIYTPMQREYGRLNITGTVLSKRKIAKLVAEGYVRGWNDPRLYTLIALRRRGIPPGAILAFVNELGVSTATTNIQIVRFEQTVRQYLEQTVPRLMVILDPIPVVIEDLPDGYEEGVELPFSPKHPEFGSHTVKFTKTVFIDRSDFRQTDSKDYFRLTPGKSVGLFKVPYPIRATTFSTDPKTGLVTEVRAVYEKPAGGQPFKKPKTYIQWVGLEHRKVEARIFNQLFRSENPDSAPGGFMNDLNPESEVIYPSALIETGFEEVRRRAPWPEQAGEAALKKGEAGPETVRFQGLRVAYFAVDSDSTEERVVLNRIVGLKEDAGKAA